MAGPVVCAHKIAVDDARRMHVFEPTLSGRDEDEAGIDREAGLTRIWYKKY